MHEASKNRLVGASVLALVMIGVLAWLLSGSPSPAPATAYVPAPNEGAAFDSRIVPMPADTSSDTLTDSLAEERRRLARTLPPSGDGARETVPGSAPGTSPQASEKGGASERRASAEKWLLQLASFTSQANADALREQLAAAGYAVYVEKAGVHVRVMIGPLLSRAQADAARAALEQRTRLKGVVRRAGNL